MPRLRALKELYHHGENRTYHRGEEFNANEQEAFAMVNLLKNVEVVATTPPSVKKAIEQAPKQEAAIAPEAQAAPTTTDNVEPIAKRRTYKRRDMRSEN